MVRRALMIAGCTLGAALAMPTQAKDVAVANEAVAKSTIGPALKAAAPSEAIRVAIFDGRELVWSGSLRIGGPYGNANFSQSKSEYSEACASDPASATRYTSASESLNFGISRSNWQQEPDRFNVNLNWSSPVASCQGEGNDSFGFNRVVTVPRGQAVTIAGNGDLSVQLTRAR